MAKTQFSKAFMSSGQAATTLGVSIRTIQLWSDRGLLTAALTAKGHRRFLTKEVLALQEKRVSPDPFSFMLTFGGAPASELMPKVAVTIDGKMSLILPGFNQVETPKGVLRSERSVTSGTRAFIASVSWVVPHDFAKKPPGVYPIPNHDLNFWLESPCRALAQNHE